MAYSDNKSSIHLMAKIQLPYPSTTIKGWEEKKKREDKKRIMWVYSVLAMELMDRLQTFFFFFALLFIFRISSHLQKSNPLTFPKSWVVTFFSKIDFSKVTNFCWKKPQFFLPKNHKIEKNSSINHWSWVFGLDSSPSH
jgi:hypothetical protein